MRGMPVGLTWYSGGLMTKDGLRSEDKQQGDLQDQGRAVPEGLKRPRKGPLDKDLGRAYEEAAKQPPSPGQPAKGE
jgi:hypothetical protein